MTEGRTVSDPYKRLREALSARETLSINRGEARLNRRGERVLNYLRLRHVREEWARFQTEGAGYVPRFFPD
jgi:hypothetical protein